MMNRGVKGSGEPAGALGASLQAKAERPQAPIQTYVYMCMHVCVYVCAHVYACTGAYVCAWACRCVHVHHVYAHTCVHVCMCMRVRECACPVSEMQPGAGLFPAVADGLSLRGGSLSLSMQGSGWGEAHL